MSRHCLFLPFSFLLIAACGDSGPQAPEQFMTFSPGGFIGQWKVTVPQVPIAEIAIINNVVGNMTVDSVSYKINLAYSSADTLHLNFLESGLWHWDSQNANLLFFDYSSSSFEIVKRVESKSQVSTSRFGSNNNNGGAWYCSYKFGEHRITLLDANGKGAAIFDSLYLTAE